ncbi:MAG: hypothetical protein JHC93_07815, partial [Parachlamydiales bacterium]|nr:hypothetical protein [Parachlamydiales bacterium]
MTSINTNIKDTFNRQKCLGHYQATRLFKTFHDQTPCDLSKLPKDILMNQLAQYISMPMASKMLLVN